MNRRHFISALAAFTLDPERLLWRPRQKLISIPKPQSHVFLSQLVCERVFTLAELVKLGKFEGGTYILEPFTYGDSRKWTA